jgi:hypothetical protein
LKGDLGRSPWALMAFCEKVEPLGAGLLRSRSSNPSSILSPTALVAALRGGGRDEVRCPRGRHEEGAPLARLALDPDLPIGRLATLRVDLQSESGAGEPLGAVQPLERAEEPRALLGRHARPPSTTASLPWPPSCSSWTRIVPPDGDYLIALETRLVTTWCSRAASPRPGRVSGADIWKVRSGIHPTPEAVAATNI